MRDVLLNLLDYLTLKGRSTTGATRNRILKQDTSAAEYPRCSSSSSLSSKATTKLEPSSCGRGLAPNLQEEGKSIQSKDAFVCQMFVVSLSLNISYLNRMRSISGAEACRATRRGDALPQDSMGTSMNLRRRF